MDTTDASPLDGGVGPLTRAWRAVRRSEPAPLPVPSADDRTMWESGSGIHAPTLTALRDRAERDLGTPWPAAAASLYALFWRDGDRDRYEQRVFARQRRLTRTAVMAAVTLDDNWIDEVVDGVVMLCEQSSWCWPAHDDAAARGSALPDPSRPFLDLGAGEVVSQLAWIDRLLGAILDARAPGLRARMTHEARTRVLDPFMSRRDWHWIGLDGDVHNWNPWIHGNVIVGALAFADPDQREPIVDRAVRGIDIYLASLPEDGAVDEGYGYWWNGACRALEAIETIASCYGDLDLSTLPALRASIAFPRAMHLGGPWFVSIADSVARPAADAPWHSLHRAARRWSEPAAAAFAASRVAAGVPLATESEGCGRLLLALTDRSWHAVVGGEEPPGADTWLPSVQIGVMRPRGRGRLTAVLKGGHNDEHHNHLDVGSMIVAIDGTPVIVDPGRPTYTRATFSAARYDTWTMRDDWHSVPAIAGAAQGIGVDFRAHHATAEFADDSSGIRLDIAAAYRQRPVSRWLRDVRVDHASGDVTIRDEWTVDDAAEDTSWRIVIAGTVLNPDSPVRVRSLSGAVVEIAWDAALDATWDTRELEDPMLADVWGRTLSRLTVRVPHTARRDAFTVTVREDT